MHVSIVCQNMVFGFVCKSIRDIEVCVGKSLVVFGRIIRSVSSLLFDEKFLPRFYWVMVKPKTRSCYSIRAIGMFIYEAVRQPIAQHLYSSVEFCAMLNDTIYPRKAHDGLAPTAGFMCLRGASNKTGCDAFIPIRTRPKNSLVYGDASCGLKIGLQYLWKTAKFWIEHKLINVDHGHPSYAALQGVASVSVCNGLSCAFWPIPWDAFNVMLRFEKSLGCVRALVVVYTEQFDTLKSVKRQPFWQIARFIANHRAYRYGHICFLALWPMVALAQQPTPHDQAMGAQIMACVGDAVQVREQLAILQAQLATTQAELAKLKEAAPQSPPAPKSSP